MFSSEIIICNNYILNLLKSIKNVNIKIYNSEFIRLISKIVNKNKIFKNQKINLDNCIDYYKIFIKSAEIVNPSLNDLVEVEKWLKNQPLENPNNPYVYLHNRDSKFLPGPQWHYHSYRDFSPKCFLPITKKYRKKLNFIRGGSVGEEVFPGTNQNVIDLPFTLHNDKINILLQKIAWFYFGSDSGCNCVAYAFRKPIAGINFPSTAFGEMRRANFFKYGFIPKKLKDKKTNSFIGLKEMYERKIINIWYAEHFEKMHLHNEENSPEEVLEFFEECLTKAQKQEPETRKISPEQEEFWKIVTFYEPESKSERLILENCFIGQSFLEKNKYLLN